MDLAHASNMFLLAAAGGNNWSIGNLLQNATTSVKTWGGLLLMLIGVCLIIVMGVIGAVKIMTQGCQKWAWPLIVVGLFLGGVLAVGGYTTLADVAAGGHATINELGRTSTT